MTSENVPLIDVGSFDRVDDAASPEAFIAWMEHQRSKGADRALDSLQLTGDDLVLDIGCGTGVDLQALSLQAGHAIGIDYSAAMAAAARTRDDTLPTSVAVADGQFLPFRDQSFDGCWARAVLLHTPDPQRVIFEVARILKPGSRVVLSEPDHGSHVVSTSETEVFERIKMYRRTMFRNPLVGRRLGELVTTAGLTLERTWVSPVVHRSLAGARAAGGPFDVAVQAAVDDNAITRDEARRYLDSLVELETRGAFLFAGLAVSVVATA